jgi:hypothetical protein
MGHKAGQQSLNRKRLARQRALEREREQFNALEEITSESEVYPEQSDWEFYKQRGWKYSREWKAFFAPPESVQQLINTVAIDKRG